MEITTIVNRDKSSRAILSEAHNLVVTNIKNSMFIRGISIEDNITRSSISKRDRNTVISHGTSVASLPVLAIDEISTISESRPEQPGNESRAISDGGNSLVRAHTLADTGPSAGGLGVSDIFTTVNGPHGSSDNSLSILGNIARATGRSGWLRIAAGGDSANGGAANDIDVGDPAGSSIETDLSPPVIRVALGIDVATLCLADGVLVGLGDRSDDTVVGGGTRADVDTISPDSDAGGMSGESEGD
jgi:hypothetical protein